MAVAEKELPKMTVESLQRELTLVKQQNIAVIGDGNVFVKRTPEGMIKAVKAQITLKEENGELAYIYPKMMTTAKGFYHANQIAGLSIITPDKLTLPNGQVVVNPYPITDQESGTISKVWVKKMAIGFNPFGVLVATSATLLYDINMYYIQDLVKKVQANAGSGRICMEAMLTADEKQKGMFYKIDGMMGVYADFSNKDVLKAVENFIQKKLFAERNAQTIAERVALAKHPALAHMAYVNPTGAEKHRSASVTVVGFIHDFNQQQLLEIAKQAEEGGEIVVDGQKAEVIETVGEASVDDMTVDVDDEERAAANDQDNANPVLGGDMF